MNALKIYDLFSNNSVQDRVDQLLYIFEHQNKKCLEVLKKMEDLKKDYTNIKRITENDLPCGLNANESKHMAEYIIMLINTSWEEYKYLYIQGLIDGMSCLKN